ncbi:hypothetical protein QJS04_geneDACA019828 [Acorus gramineus]|uniref:Uncharacterized protein n=1 Tax=Acorus gramineus TaxID=55184 RepID=A0AAV9BVI7_ACOGR|nr:hypothetical protein QJS04_geneDACA019828 [Acorus gramineus]
MSHHHHHLTLRNLLLLCSSLSLLLLLLYSLHPINPPLTRPPPPPSATPLSLRHLVFGIASSALSFPSRRPYLRLWWDPPNTQGFIFLDRNLSFSDDPSLPPLSELVALIDESGPSDARWVVLGDDDTVFFPENLVRTLAKYDSRMWYYVGSTSESFDQNVQNSFGMAFGGGGIALSLPLARVLARVLDGCLKRYSRLYGSDARIYSCLAELGVGLTREPGFHQVDIRGDLFGMLSAHPLAPLVSLHHLDKVEPIFPMMDRVQALGHLFKAVKVDPGRILQQSVCYDRSESPRTVSVSWGYNVQVFEGNWLLPDLVSWQRTFLPWRRGRNVGLIRYMANTREVPKDLCQRPVVFFLLNVTSDSSGIQSIYGRNIAESCLQGMSLTKHLQHIRVFSEKFDLDIKQAPRRHCCDVLPSSSNTTMDIGIRKCKYDELISMDS